MIETSSWGSYKYTRWRKSCVEGSTQKLENVSSKYTSVRWIGVWQWWQKATNTMKQYNDDVFVVENDDDVDDDEAGKSSGGEKKKTDLGYVWL